LKRNLTKSSGHALRLTVRRDAASWSQSIKNVWRLSCAYGGGVPFVAQKPLALEYKGCPLRAKYEPDFICYEKIILELKAVSELAEEHRAQVQNYLKATRFKLGLLVNFGHYPKVQFERIVAEQGRYARGR
jgi:GxxExxY protein